MSEQLVNGAPGVPAHFLRFRATLTDGVGQEAQIDIAALNHLGGLAALQKFLCDNPVEIKTIVFVQTAGGGVTQTIVPATQIPIIRRQ